LVCRIPLARNRRQSSAEIPRRYSRVFIAIGELSG
jgi:hypothetical protein